MKIKYYFSEFTVAAYFLFYACMPTLLMIVPNGLTYVNSGIVLVLVLGFVNVLLNGFEHNFEDNFLWIILLFSLSVLTNYILQSDKFAIARNVLYVFIFLLFIPKIGREKLFHVIVLSLVFSGLVSGVWQMFFSWEHPSVRVGGYINPIPFAYMSYVCLTFSVVMLLDSYKYERDKVKIAIFSLSALFSTLAIIISETRGVWIALPVLSIYLIANFINVVGFRKITPYFFVATLAIVFLAGETMHDRYEHTMIEVNKIINNDYSSSLGIRLRLWEIAIDITKEYPLFGVGEDGFNSIKAMTFETVHTHAHNQYLDVSSKRGIISLCVLMMVILYPIYTVYKVRSKPQAQMVLLTSLSYAVFCLTDTPFSSAYSLYFYLLIISGCLHSLSREKNKHLNEVAL